MLKLSVSAVMFSKQFLAYTVHIDWCYYTIHKHSSRSQHISVANYIYLYDDIGDGSSSLRGSTSSFFPVGSQWRMGGQPIKVIPYVA